MAKDIHMTVQVLRAQVEQDGAVLASYREDMRNEIAMVRMREHEVESKIQVSEGEIDNLLAEQGGEAAEKVEYNIAQILLELPEIASPERVEAAHRRAEELVAQAKGGVGFAQLAAGYSRPPRGCPTGGFGSLRTE